MGAPVHLIDAQIDRCHLGRWNEPGEGMRRMAALVFNNSESRSFNYARLKIWGTEAPARATSEYPVSIPRQGTALFLFVGPLRAISLDGFYAGPQVLFHEREPPASCRTLTLHQMLRLVEVYQPENTLRSRIPNFDSTVEVEVIRIQFSDTIITESGNQELTEQHFKFLHDDREMPASIECW